MGLEAEVDDEDLHPGKNRRTVIDFLEFWISTIVTYARSEQVAFPKIILIGTHKDKIKDKSELERTKKKIEDTFQEMVQREQLLVRDDLFISAKNMSDVSRQAIRYIILEEGMKYKEFGERVPASWNVLQETLMKLKSNNEYIVSRDAIKKINIEAQSPLDEEELDIFLKYLHSIGYILYFSTAVLNEKIILDPKLVILAMRSIITSERFIKGRSLETVWRNMRETGQVKKSHILKMWTEKGIAEHSDHLLAIMKKLDLICEPMIYKGGQQLSSDFYVVPSMIDTETPNVPLVQVQHEKPAQLVFSSKTLLPPAIFNRLVCSCLVFWAIYQNHFYNGLVVLKIGRFHIMEMRRQVYEVVVKIAHTDPERNPDGQLCFAIKQFLAETLDQIVAVYSASDDKPITLDSSNIDALFDDQYADTKRDASNENNSCNCDCNCDEYTACRLEDVHMMRLADLLSGVDLTVLCTVLLNDASYSEKISNNWAAFNSDVKNFYVLQEWKNRSQTVGVTELRDLLRDNLGDTYKHAICQALAKGISRADNLDRIIRVSKVYPEFLDAVADNIAFKYLHLGLELGFTLKEMERLKIENTKVLEISRAMMKTWNENQKEDAIVLNLANAFYRCGFKNLAWMEAEYDLEVMLKEDEVEPQEPRQSTQRRCSIL